jgi:hypothetical protein
MAYGLTWHTEKQIVLLSLHRESSVEDFRAFTREITAKYLDASSTPVHVMVDMSRLERFPIQLVKIRAASSDLFRHPKLGKVVIVGRTNPLAGCIIDTLARTFRVECLWAANLEQARLLVTQPARLVPFRYAMNYRQSNPQLP